MSVDGGASPGQQEPATRGFLFADLRGYTDYVERHGDDAGAALLDRYRRMVREVVARQSGAEVRTEGDSVLRRCFRPPAAPSRRRSTSSRRPRTRRPPGRTHRFGSASVSTPARRRRRQRARLARPVNIAARICAQAKAGEVLVSDTVRGLTRTRQVGTFELGRHAPAQGHRRTDGVVSSRADRGLNLGQDRRDVAHPSMALCSRRGSRAA